ncbi:TPA: hypothetical protein KL481_004516 [Escherichia coli]|nr:hypothetical protein [Escherichia coli]
MINGNYTFKNLNPDAERFGLSEDDYYQLCLQLLEVVCNVGYEGGRYRPRELLETAKADGFEDGEMASCQICDLLMPDGCLVKDTLAMLKDFLPDKADRRAVLTHMLTEDFFAPVDVEDEKYIGCWFNYNDWQQFTWSLTGTLFFEYAYDYEVIHGI